MLVGADSELNFEFVERSPDARPSFRLSEQEDREFFFKVMDSLQDEFPNYSDPVFLWVIEEFTYDEIGVELRITKDAARMKVKRGKEKFKRIYNAMK